MPHLRHRYALLALKRKLNFARVVSIQGVRQCGKSFLVSHFLKESHPRLLLERFDLTTTRAFATESPDLFLRERADARPLVIDEAQRVPGIFDAIKVRVDENPTPGRFVLLGSTEFSHLFRIQESLTGRMSRLRLFPMTLAEDLKLPLRKGDLHALFFTKPRATLEQVLRMLERGGMPGIFSVRADDEREALIEDWVSLTCNRDIHQIPRQRLDSDLAREILGEVARAEHPVASDIAKAVRGNTKVVARHLAALETLFVLHRLRPHPAGTGKDRYYLCDVGIARFLGATKQRALETWLLQEFLARRALLNAPSKLRLSYFRTSKGSVVPLVIEDETLGTTTAVRALHKDKVDRRDLEVLRSLRRAIERSSTPAGGRFVPVLLLGGPARREVDDVHVLPWGAIV